VRGYSNQDEVTVNGHHYIQEESPDDTGKTMVEQYPTL
jgi:hypothetical protein